MKLTTVFLINTLGLASTALGASVNFYTTREGTCNGSASQEFRNIPCNSCVDPPGDWWGIQVFDIGSDNRVSVHNQNNCTPASQVGQWYGNVCAAAGATAIRSVWVACPGARFAKSATHAADADKATVVQID